jgi:hypothetical protein
VLGWMKTDDYLALAEHSMETLVLQPLLARGIPVVGRTPEAIELV